MTKSQSLLNIISTLTDQSLDPGEVMNVTLEKILKLLQAQVATIYLLDSTGKELHLGAYRPSNIPPHIIKEISTIKVGEGYAGQVVKSGETMVAKDISTLKDRAAVAALKAGLRSIIAIPLKSKNKLLGVMDILTATQKNFSEEEIHLLNIIGHQIGSAIDNARLYERVKESEEELIKRHHELVLVLNVCTMISSTLSLEEAMQNIVQTSLNNFNIDVALIRVVENDQLVVKASAYRYPEEGRKLERLFAAHPLYLNQGIASKVIKTGIPSLINQGEVEVEKLTIPGLVDYLKERSLIVAPLKTKEKIIGVLILVARRNFSLNDLSLAMAVSTQSAIALDNANLFQKVVNEAEEIQSLYEQTISSLVSALDAREKETSVHSVLVSQYSLQLAREINDPDLDFPTLIKASLLHDIGKIGIPDNVLLKRTKLTPKEKKVIRRHPQIGYDILKNVPALKRVAEIILTHQEWYNGQGYPQGLADQDIPLEARIFAIADTLDAMTSDRPYRAACSFKKMREEIVRYKGTQFDPRLVDVFLAIPEKEWEKIHQGVCGKSFVKTQKGKKKRRGKKLAKVK